jgi:threonine dehydrogenase-like Zn-dependent dehydrogenase
VRPGDIVAVWGAGGVGQMAARAAMLMGAERVVVIDRYDNRLEQVRTHIGAPNGVRTRWLRLAPGRDGQGSRVSAVT